MKNNSNVLRFLSFMYWYLANILFYVKVSKKYDKENIKIEVKRSQKERRNNLIAKNWKVQKAHGSRSGLVVNSMEFFLSKSCC